jgi:hypothetical protein
MKPGRPFSVVAVLAAQSLAFSLALLVVARLLDEASLSWWSIVAAVGAAYLVMGAVSGTGLRRPLLVGLSAFLAPLVILGWIGWRTTYGLLLRHVQASEDVLPLLLAPANLVTALFLSLCALVGYGLSRRLRRRAP